MQWLLIAASAGALWTSVEARRIQGAPLRPTVAERVAYTALVADLARAAPRGVVPRDAGARAERLGLEVEREDEVVWLREPEGVLAGRGVVVLRLGALATEVVLQAPHPVSDLHTGAVAADLFDAGGIRAACFATFHRAAADGADPGRDTEGWLQAATDGLARAVSHPLFVQLHGFSAETSPADLVVSEGSALAAPEWLLGARDVLEDALHVEDGLTGADVAALAARGNVQSQLLAGRAGFLHLELSFALRTRLSEEAELRRALGAALLTIASTRSPG